MNNDEEKKNLDKQAMHDILSMIAKSRWKFSEYASPKLKSRITKPFKSKNSRRREQSLVFKKNV